MNYIRLCTMHSDKPYFIKEVNKNIYSIEEISYYLYNYLYLIDDKFFSDELIEYIEKELDQPNIAAGIKQIILHGQNGRKIRAPSGRSLFQNIGRTLESKGGYSDGYGKIQYGNKLL